MHKPNIIFFGTPEYAVIVLEKLKQANLTPTLIVTMPNRPGKHLVMTPPPAKVWAEKNNVPVLQPDNLKDQYFLDTLKNTNPDLGVVIAYGKIITQDILNIPKYNFVNIHGSLLPKLRGASPIETAILEDMKETGVTLMLMDEDMDHGPIIAQEKVICEPWPVTSNELGKEIVTSGANLLIKAIPDILAGKIIPQEQDHTQATFTKKIKKQDGEINVHDDPYLNFRKIQAYQEWPTAYFFIEKNGKKMRVIITQAEYKDNTLKILKVIPEGKKEVDYETFTRSLNQ